MSLPHITTLETWIKTTFIQHYCRNYDVNSTLLSPPFKLLLAKHCSTASRHNISICVSGDAMRGLLSELFTVFGLHRVLKETFGPSARSLCYVYLAAIRSVWLNQQSSINHLIDDMKLQKVKINCWVRFTTIQNSFNIPSFDPLLLNYWLQLI